MRALRAGRGLRTKLFLARDECTLLQKVGFPLSLSLSRCFWLAALEWDRESSRFNAARVIPVVGIYNKAGNLYNTSKRLYFASILL